MQIKAVLLSAILALSVLAPAAASAPAAPAATAAPSATPITLPATLQSQIDAAVAACNCFTSVTAFQVTPNASAAEVFSSGDILFAILDLDVQLPWVASGEINETALATRLTPSGQQGLVTKIQKFADPPSGPFRLGAWSWLHPTQPDFCSGETLYLQYFEHTGVLFAFRFDSSHEC